MPKKRHASSKWFKAKDGWACSACGQVYDSEPQVIGHQRFCKGITGLAQSLSQGLTKLLQNQGVSGQPEPTEVPARLPAGLPPPPPAPYRGGLATAPAPGYAPYDQVIEVVSDQRRVIAFQSREIQNLQSRLGGLEEHMLNHYQHLQEQPVKGQNKWWLWIAGAFGLGVVVGLSSKGSNAMGNPSPIKQVGNRAVARIGDRVIDQAISSLFG